MSNVEIVPIEKRAELPAATLAPRNLSEAMEFSKLVSQCAIVPKDYQGKPANVLVALQWGMELGLAPMQAMQNITVINGRPSIWGDAMLAICMAHPQRVRCASPKATASSTAVATVPQAQRNSRATCFQGRTRVQIASVTISGRVMRCLPLTHDIDSTWTPPHREQLTRQGA